MSTANLTQHVGEVLDYPYDWTSRLASGETISTVATAIEPTGEAAIDSGGTTHVSNVVSPFISGVVAGNAYKLQTTIVTNQGRTDTHERTIHGVA